MDLSLLVFDACNTFFALYIICELGQRLSDAFEEINELIDQFQWYRFHKNMKRILPTAMIIVQKPVSVECFGSLLCGREVFKKVWCEIESIRTFSSLHSFTN